MWLRAVSKLEGLVNKMSGMATSEAMDDVLFGFFETIIALHQLLPRKSHLLLNLDESQRRLRVIGESLGIGPEDLPKYEEWERKYAKAILDRPEGIDIGDIPEREDLQRELAEILKSSKKSFDATAARVHMTVKQLEARPRPAVLIHRAVLIAGVGAFESLVVSLVQSYLLANPIKATGQEKEYSLADLMELGNINEVIDQAITRRVEVTLRGGIESWTAWFRQLDIDFENLCIDWNQVTEVFERRHSYVHTQGKVNPSYFRKVKNASPVGTPLPLNDSYLKQALGQLVCLGALVGTKTWPLIDPDVDWLIVAGIPYLYYDELMELGQWSAVAKIANVTKNYKTTLDVRFRIKCIEWLAAKHLHGLEAIAKAVTDWDTSALQSSYSFRRALLLDDFESAKGIFTEALKRRESWTDSISDFLEVKHQDTAREFVKTLAQDLG
jgi:hypothetical protein